MALTRDDILSVADVSVIPVPCDAWGGPVLMRKLSCHAAEEWQQYLLDAQRNGGGMKLIGMRPKLLSLVLCDAAGHLLFNEEDLEALGEKDSEVVQELFDHAKKINAMDLDAGDNAEKNSETSL